MTTRRSWDHYFMRIAAEVATRSTCDRAHVGCVIVVEKSILSSGYNGSVPGMPHCDDVGHMMDGNNSCVRTLHAEQNAVIQIAKAGVPLRQGSRPTVYCTHIPCWMCWKMLASIGVGRIVYDHDRRIDQRVVEGCEVLGISLIKFEYPTENSNEAKAAE